MLSPEYLWSVSDSVVNIYDEMNNWAIQDMIERITAAELYEYDKLPGTARYRAWMLNQAGEHYEEMAKKVAEATKKSEADIMKLFIDAGLTAIANDFEPFDKQPYDIRQDRRATQILQAAYDQTNGELRNYTRTTLDRSNKLMIDTLDKAYFDVSTGAKSYSEVVREAIDTVSSIGCEVEYPKTGHVDSIETAVRRAVMTGVNQGTSKISLLNCEKLGTDYVIVSAHIGARYSEKNKVANHLGWQGKVYKIHGTDTYKNKKGEMINILNLEEETGFPSDPLGLCGYNCRHSFYPFLLGIDDLKKYKYIVTDEEESKKQYDLSQKQRAKERAIRKTKTDLLAYNTAIENCKDEKTKFDLQLEYDKRAAKLQNQNKAYRAFCEDNNLQMEQERIKVAKWQREQAYQATRGARRYNDYKKTENTVGNQSNGYRQFFYERNIKQYPHVESNAKWDSKISGLSNENSQLLNDIHTDVNEHIHDKKTEKSIIMSISENIVINSDIGTKIDETKLSNKTLKYLKDYQSNDIILTHVHPSNDSFGLFDIDKLIRYKSVKALTLECIDGRKYILERGEFISSKINILKYNMGIDDIISNVRKRYPNINSDNPIEQYAEFEKYLLDLNKAIAEKYGMVFKEVQNEQR